MRGLTAREKWMLAGCFAVIFLVANGFAARYIAKNLRGSGDQIRLLENEIADAEMWLGDAEKADVRERWLMEKMPRAEGGRLTKELGDLLQELQDDLFEKKIKIEQQSMQEVVRETFHAEVAVRLNVRGEQAAIFDWLTGLQDPEKFVVIKALELKLDSKSKETEPQAVCQITVARWFDPDSSETESPDKAADEAEAETDEDEDEGGASS